MKATKTRAVRLTSLTEDVTSVPEDAPFRARLHFLFAQIGREFEQLYLENQSCEFHGFQGYIAGSKYVECFSDLKYNLLFEFHKNENNQSHIN